MSTARHATQSDLPAIMDLLRQMHAESRFREWPINAKKLESLVRTLSSYPDGCCIVATVGDQVVGVILGYVEEFFFSNERQAGELVMYVLPEHRGSWAAIRMQQAFISWADQTDAVEIQVGVSANIENAAAERFYEGLGFSPLGRSFTKELDHVRT